MAELNRGWSVTAPRHPNFDCEPELTIVIRVDSWGEAKEAWQHMLSSCDPERDRRGTDPVAK